MENAEIIGKVLIALASIVGVFTAVGVPLYRYVDKNSERDARQEERQARQEERQEASNATLKRIEEQLEKNVTIYQQDHDAIWKKIAEHENSIGSHELRIHNLEEKR